MIDITPPAYIADLLLLLIRVIVAVAFIISARNKFRDIKKFAANDGVPLPVAYFVATAEICGGLGLLTGVLAQWAAIGLMLLMIGTMSLHIFKWHSPYWASKGGWEYDLMLFALSGVIAVYGAGTFVIMSLFVI